MTWPHSPHEQYNKDNTAITDIVPHMLIKRHVSSSNDNMRMEAPGKPLWRKREVVRSERMVHYTTVDASGLVQELVEKETTETEVLHMECRETGEFAHRETTKYEQHETFNDEVGRISTL